MDKLFYPDSVAVIGLSENPMNLGRNIMKNLITWKFPGEIYGVNPKGGKVFGKKLYHSVLDIPKSVDLAAILTPAKAIPQIVEECGQKGIKWLTISSGGLSEFDEIGKEISEEIKKISQKYGIKYVGPNGLAIFNIDYHLCLPFVPMEKPEKIGRISVLSQSGGVGLTILLLLYNENLLFNKFISLGNKESLDEVDFIRYLSRDKGTDVIVAYLESMERGKEFMQAVRETDKPVIVYKGNTGKLSAKAAMSHTAALSNDDQVVEAALKQCGAIRVKELKELATYPKIFSLPQVKGNRLGVISPAGGYTVIGSDLCEKYGFTIPDIPEEMKEDFMSRMRAGVIKLSNPLDLGDAFDLRIFLHAIDKFLELDYIDGLIWLFFLSSTNVELSQHYNNIQQDIIGKIESSMKKYKKPIAVSLTSTQDVAAYMKKILPYPIFDTPEEAISLLAFQRDYYLEKKKKYQKPPQFEDVNKDKVEKIIHRSRKNGVILGKEALDLISSYKISSVQSYLAKNIDEAIKITKRIVFPVVMKISSSEIIHKSDMGGVKLNLKNTGEIKSAYQEIMKNIHKQKDSAIIDGVLIQKMVTEGKEIILGMNRDKYFGPVLMFGLGGIYVEVLKDIALGVAPINGDEADKMISETRSYPLLMGLRGEKPSHLSSIRESLLRLSQLAIDFPEITEIDINPIKVFSYPDGCLALDARIRLGNEIK